MTWNPPRQQAHEPLRSREALLALEGAWVDQEYCTHLYSRIVDDELVTPYCFGGGDHLTSVYYGWKTVGEFWFARFCWLTHDISGFAFLKQESADLLAGAWWGDSGVEEVSDSPNLRSGVSTRWVRKRNAQFPAWALRFFEEVRRERIVNCLAKRCS